MFHAVTEEAERDWGPWQYAVTPSEFEAVVAYLAKKRTIVLLDDIVAWVRSGDPIPDDAVAITFDDGYRNYMTNALPVLRKYDAPSVVYLSSSLVGNDRQSPYEFRLANALESQIGSIVSVDCLGLEMSINTKADMANAYEFIRSKSKYRNASFRQTIISSIGDGRSEPIPMLSSSTVRSLASDPLVVCGSHGMEHVPFEILSDDEQRNAVEKSSSQLSVLLNTLPRHFSFPYGSYNATAIQSLRDAELVSGVTTHDRSLSPRDWDSPYTLPRVDGATTSLPVI